MRRIHRYLFAVCWLALAVLLGVGGCAHQWDSVLDGNLYHRTSLNRYPVVIAAVDGDYSLQRPRLIAAGVHRLLVEAPPVAGFHTPERKEFAFRAEKCVRYWLVAQRAGPLSRDFDLVVDHAEPVPGCQPASGAPTSAVLIPAVVDPPRAIPVPKRP